MIFKRGSARTLLCQGTGVLCPQEIVILMISVILHDPKIKPLAKLVYVALHTFPAEATVANLTRWFGCSRRSVFRALNALEAAGYIHRKDANWPPLEGIDWSKIDRSVDQKRLSDLIPDTENDLREALDQALKMSTGSIDPKPKDPSILPQKSPPKMAQKTPSRSIDPKEKIAPAERLKRGKRGRIEEIILRTRKSREKII